MTNAVPKAGSVLLVIHHWFIHHWFIHHWFIHHWFIHHWFIHHWFIHHWSFVIGHLGTGPFQSRHQVVSSRPSSSHQRSSICLSRRATPSRVTPGGAGTSTWSRSNTRERSPACTRDRRCQSVKASSFSACPRTTP